jgi:hypothetical protein
VLLSPPLLKTAAATRDAETGIPPVSANGSAPPV